MRDGGGSTASARFRRLLHILPAAHREGGVSYRELAEELGVSDRTIAADVQQLIERSYHFRAGSPGEVRIMLGEDRVQVWTSGEFRRPVRLSPREALALGLGLRMAALSPTAGGSESREAVRRRLEAHLAAGSAEEVIDRFEAGDLRPDPEGLRELLSLAARDRKSTRIRYLKAGDDGHEERVVHPYLLAHAEGAWYVVGHCESAGGVRVFRIDRILDAAATEAHFEPAEDFDPADYLDGSRVFRAEHDIEARVRYSPLVARWLEESGEGEPDEDGGRIIRHRVADPGWLVRLVLEHGGEAEVLEPAELRRKVGEAARRVAERHS